MIEKETIKLKQMCANLLSRYLFHQLENILFISIDYRLKDNSQFKYYYQSQKYDSLCQLLYSVKVSIM